MAEQALRRKKRKKSKAFRALEIAEAAGCSGGSGGAAGNFFSVFNHITRSADFQDALSGWREAGGHKMNKYSYVRMQNKTKNNAVTCFECYFLALRSCFYSIGNMLKFLMRFKDKIHIFVFFATNI